MFETYFLILQLNREHEYICLSTMLMSRNCMRTVRNVLRTDHPFNRFRQNMYCSTQVHRPGPHTCALLSLQLKTVLILSGRTLDPSSKNEPQLRVCQQHSLPENSRHINDPSAALLDKETPRATTQLGLQLKVYNVTAEQCLGKAIALFMDVSYAPDHHLKIRRLDCNNTASKG